MISFSGMAHIFAFQNHKHVLLKEHTSFLKHEKLGVLESLFFSHSGKAKKDGFQNQKRSANDIFKPFRNTKKMAIPEPQTATTFRKALKKGFSERIFCQMFWKEWLWGCSEMSCCWAFQNGVPEALPETPEFLDEIPVRNSKRDGCWRKEWQRGVREVVVEKDW